MADAGAGGDDLEIVEALAAPFQEVIALHVALIFQLDVILERLGRAEFVDHDRVVDDEVDGDLRIDLRRVRAERVHRVAHRGEIDHAGNAGEILHQHARGAILDLALRRARVVLPVDDRLGILRADGHAVFEAEHVFQQHLHAERQTADIAQLLGRFGKAEIGVALATHGKRVTRPEAVLTDGCHVRVPFPVVLTPGVTGRRQMPRERAGVRMRRFAWPIAGRGRGGKGRGCGEGEEASARRDFRLMLP